ncbi:MAG: hemolysin family protein [Dehalococcoidia bacterium]
MIESINMVYLIVFIICLLVSAFFSSSETAFTSLQKVRLKHLVSSGVSGADAVAKVTERPEKLLTTVLVGNNFVNTAASALGTIIIVTFLGDEYGVIVATVVVTFLLLIFSEIGPKTMATKMGERMALLYICPIKAIVWILSPFTYILSGIGTGIARVVGGDAVAQNVITEQEIRDVISIGHEDGAVEEDEAEMMKRVSVFGDRHVGEIMTPRTDVIWVEKGTTVKEFMPVYAESPHSRFPVYEETVDNVSGIIWIKDVLLAHAQGELVEDASVTDLSRQAYFVPESKTVGQLFSEMQDQMREIAVVVDEYGGTAGLVTMEQLLEEIVGELGDELAAGEKRVETIGLNTYQVDGGMKIDQANEELGLDLPKDDYETVAGFILSELGCIPAEGEQLKYGETTFTVTEMKGVKIEKVLIIKE